MYMYLYHWCVNRKDHHWTIKGRYSCAALRVSHGGDATCKFRMPKTADSLGMYFTLAH